MGLRRRPSRALFILIYGATPGHSRGRYIDSPPAWLINPWFKLALVVVGLFIIGASLHIAKFIACGSPCPSRLTSGCFGSILLLSPTSSAVSWVFAMALPKPVYKHTSVNFATV